MNNPKNRMLFICSENINPRYLQAHCQSPAIPSADQSFVKELAEPTQRKIGFKNFPTLQKNKKQQVDRNHTSTQQGFGYMAGEVPRMKICADFELSDS